MDVEIFKAQQRTILLDKLCDLDLTMAYTDVGSGDPIILLHGIPTWSYLYHDVIPRLSEQYRVIAPDFLGHGYSDRRDQFDRSLRAQKCAILRFMDKLGLKRATIVGHDTGGGVALMMGIEHPDRIDKLILSNIVAYDSWPIDDMIALGNPAWRSKPPAEVAEFVAAGIPEGLYNSDRNTKSFRDGIVAPYSDEQGKISLIRNASALNTNHTMELVNHHNAVQAQTLLLWGVRDIWQPIEDAQRLAKEIPNAQLVRLENASHWLQQDSPVEFVDAIRRFLS